MTGKQRQMLSSYLAKYTAFSCQSQFYDWDNRCNSKVHKELYTDLVDKMKDLNLDFSQFTIEDVEMFGFEHWPTELAGRGPVEGAPKDVYLIPLYMYDVIPDGTVLYGMRGEKIVKGTDEKKLSDDNRYGCIGYGIVPCDLDKSKEGHKLPRRSQDRSLDNVDDNITTFVDEIQLESGE